MGASGLATAMHGPGLGSLSLAFDMQGLYGDGGNLYEYLGSNPWMRSDVLGLSYDPFDIVDEFMVGHEISKAAFLKSIGAGVQTFAAITCTIVSMCPVPIVPDLVLYATGSQGMGATAIGAVIGVIPGGRLVGAAGRWFGRVQGFAAGARMASKGIGASGTIGEDVLRALGGVSQKRFRTPFGRRIVDHFVGGIAHESKVGYKALQQK